MKKTVYLLVVLISLPAYSQRLLKAIKEHQSTLEATQTPAGKKQQATPDVKVVGATKISGAQCQEDEQTSLPLAYITGLINSKNGHLDISHDPNSGTLTIAAQGMTSNCASMIEWGVTTKEVLGAKVHVVEAKFKKSDCDKDNNCDYKVALIEDGVFKKFETMKFKPNLVGFEECLEKSGAYKDGKPNKKNIYSQPLMERFKGVDQSADLLFSSHGVVAGLPDVGAVYGDFKIRDNCDYYEQLHPKITRLTSAADLESIRLAEEAAKMKECKQYDTVADFIEKTDGQFGELVAVRNKLILEAVTKTAEAIAKGEYKEEDLKVIADFEKYIVGPKIERVKALYAEAMALEGDSRKRKLAELKIATKELAALNNKPYLIGTHTKKLLADGRFEEGEKLNTLAIIVDNFSKVGPKAGSKDITPEIALVKSTKERDKFAKDLVSEKERYEIRTGQTTGLADFYANRAKSKINAIQTRTTNFNNEIQQEYMRIQPGGYCYAYFRNTQSCINDSLQRIKELQTLANHYNKVDAEIASEFDKKAKDFGKLEAEGRRYIAQVTGEEVAEAPKTDDTTVPTVRAPDNTSPQNSWAFNYQQPQMNPQQPGMPQWQQPGMPQQMPYQQQPYMGQQMFNQFGNNNLFQAQGGYNFNWGQPQQQMYPQQQFMGSPTPYQQFPNYQQPMMPYGPR